MLLSSPDMRVLPPRRYHGACARAHNRAPRDDAAGVVDVGPRYFVRRPKTAEESVAFRVRSAIPATPRLGGTKSVSRFKAVEEGGGGVGERPAPVEQPNQPAAIA